MQRKQQKYYLDLKNIERIKAKRIMISILRDDQEEKMKRKGSNQGGNKDNNERRLLWN